METPDHLKRMRIVGGNLALDFINTQTGPPAGEPDEDALHDYADLVAWGEYVGMLSDAEANRLGRRGRGRPGDARATYKRALRLRRRLYALMSTIAAGQSPPRRSVAALRSAAADALAHAVLVPADTGFEWAWADDDLARPLWPIAHAGVALLTSGPLDRVKACCWLPVPVHRREQEPEPALVRHGGLRNGRQDAEVRSPPRRS